MTVTIQWNEGTVGEWDSLFARVPQPTLTQAFGYAQAMSKTYGWVPRLGVIQADGTAIGLVQVLERRHLKLFTLRRIHRGPLWFGDPPPGAVGAALRLLRAACPDNPIARLSFLPELPDTPENAALMAEAGFRRFGPGYRTVWIDLRQPDEALRAAMARGWRQELKKAEKAGLVMDLDPAAANLPWLAKKEHEQAQVKHYREMSGPLAVRLRNALHNRDGVLLAAAVDGKEAVSAGLFFGHGTAATYQLGWSNDRGRKTSAMRLVLWKAIGHLRERGFQWLDLGGINPDTAPGVTDFKLGTGGTVFESVGLYH